MTREEEDDLLAPAAAALAATPEAVLPPLSPLLDELACAEVDADGGDVGCFLVLSLGDIEVGGGGEEDVFFILSLEDVEGPALGEVLLRVLLLTKLNKPDREGRAVFVVLVGEAEDNDFGGVASSLVFFPPLVVLPLLSFLSFLSSFASFLSFVPLAPCCSLLLRFPIFLFGGRRFSFFLLTTGSRARHFLHWQIFWGATGLLNPSDTKGDLWQSLVCAGSTQNYLSSHAFPGSRFRNKAGSVRKSPIFHRSNANLLSFSANLSKKILVWLLKPIV